MTRRFDHLNVPNQFKHYWTKYPEGYTILEALLNWVRQVDEMVDNVNDWNKRLDEFIAQFDGELKKTVTNLLREWQADGSLDIIISEALQTQITEVATLATFVRTAKTDGVYDNTADIRDAIQRAGVNGKVYFPKPQVAYVIKEPIYLLDGQTLEGAPNTRIYDRTDYYAFVVEGGAGFASQAFQRIGFKNLLFPGSNTSRGAIRMRNVFMVDMEQVYAYLYTSPNAAVISIEDFFQINLTSVHIYANRNGIGLKVDCRTGNSGQMNLYNCLIQRNHIGVDLGATSNLIDGFIMYGGAIGNNYYRGLRLGRNTNNVMFIGSHIENHSGTTLAGEPMAFGAAAIDMTTAVNCNGVQFLGCFFINNKQSIISNGVARCIVTGNQFNAENIPDSVAIVQGANDVAWDIGVNQYLNITREIDTAGNYHMDKRTISQGPGFYHFTRGGFGFFYGSNSPEGVVTAPVGSIYLRTDAGFGTGIYTKKTGTGNTGWQALVQQNTVFTTAGRPSPITIGAGSEIYDSDLGIPLWSNGSVWKDALGTTR